MKLDRVEKYEVVDEIGHGGMATVYRARDTRLDRLVALKVMHPHLQGAKEARARFAREALTVARLKHPGILEIYDYSGEDSDTSYIATELLTGPTLKEFVELHEHIPAELAACIVIPLARALAAAHAEGVVHRDVKPENVMLHQDRAVKLTDFGIAQLVDAQSMTTTGQVLGSPGHMAPEQVEGKDCDQGSDIFSLGTVLYLLATGELPFVGNNPHQVLKQIVDGRVRDPLLVRESVGAPLTRIIMRCLKVDPAQRYPTAQELVKDLTAFVGELGIEAPGKALAEYLKDPDAYAERFHGDAIERLTELGEAAQQQGNRPRALEYYNRVLALDDGNERVLEAVQSMGRRSRLEKGVATAAAVAALVGLGLLAISSLQSPPPSGAEADGSDVLISAVPEPPPDLPENLLPDPASDPDPEASDGTPAARPIRPKRPRPLPRGPREIIFRPYPANVAIGVDGASPKPFGPSFRGMTLKPGEHRFKFLGAHDCCVDEEFTVKIPPGTGPYPIARRLKFRPAGLYVVSNTPSDVIVDGGRISGRARSVIKVPNRRSMQETHTVKVTADGFRDHEQEVRLQAGQVETLTVTLKPEV